MRLAALPIAATLACSAGATSSGPSVTLTDCDAAGTRAQCAEIEVPEDREHPDTMITLKVAVVPALESGAADPVVLLAGGPGQGAIDAYAPLLSRFDDLRAERDIVLLDQRGTGDSNPLKCPETEDESLEEQLSSDVDTEEVSRCKAQLAGNPIFYTTPHAVADLAEVLDKLGYAQANLIGGSYGTRMALAFARRHPDRVRSMVIDGVAPVDMTMPLSFAADADRALDRLFEDCAAEPACAGAFDNPRKQLDEVLAELGDDDRTVVVEHPRTGETTELELTAKVLASGIRGTLYVPELAALLPLSIAKAHQGDYAPLLAQTLLFSDGLSSNLAEGMFLSVICAEDVPFITDEAVARETKGTLLGSLMVDNLKESCALWDQAELPEDYRDPVAVDVPALVLSGDLDPVTPPRWGEHAAETLGNAKHLVVPGRGPRHHHRCPALPT